MAPGDPGPWESLVGTGADLRGGSGEVRKDSLKTGCGSLRPEG